MVVKDIKTKTKKFNYNKNGTTIRVSNYLRAGIRIRKTRKMVKEQNTVSPNKDSSMTKVMRSNYLRADMRIGKTKKVVRK